MPPDNWRARHLLPFDLASLSFALDQVGVREVGTSNTGPMVNAYLRAAELQPGLPWCAAFVNWCAEQAAELHDNIISPLEDVPLQGYVQSYFNWAQDNDYLVSWDEAHIGDLFCLYYPHLGRYGHIGFVYDVDPISHTFDTVEGNTNAAGGREGIEVAKKVRSMNDRTVFIRYADDCVIDWRALS